MDKTFTITCTMDERWIDSFCSLLKYMEYCGNAEYSSLIAFYANGVEDFRPKFVIDTDYQFNTGLQDYKFYRKPDIIFDTD